MKNFKFKVIGAAMLAGLFSSAMAATDPIPFYPLSDFTQGTFSCRTSAEAFGNAIWNHDWPDNELVTAGHYAILFQSTISPLTYSWNTDCTGRSCTGTTPINCESINSSSYPNSLSPAINAAAQGYIAKVLDAYKNGEDVPAGTQVVCNLNSGTCTVQ